VAIMAIHLVSAMLYLSGHCYPALVGIDTPVGEFPALHARTSEPGYGGDVIAFAQANDGGVYAIHRLWTLQPKQRRLDRLTSPSAEERRSITGGCVNISPAIYDELVGVLDGRSRIVITRD
jgi:hypothetical protein